jgi:preprotein translocase subunit SecD
MEDVLSEMKSQMQLEAAQKKLQNALSQQAANKAQMSQNPAQYDQQAIIAQADQIAQEFAQMDIGTRRSRMDALKNEDLIMASVVRERLEQMQQDQNAAQRAQR